MWQSHAEGFPFLFKHLTRSIRRRGSSYETRSKDFTGYVSATQHFSTSSSRALVCSSAGSNLVLPPQVSMVASADVLEPKLKLRLSLFKEGPSLHVLLFRMDEEAAPKYLTLLEGEFGI